MSDQVTWAERLDALQVLITAPFVIFVVATIVAAVLITAYHERSTR